MAQQLPPDTRMDLSSSRWRVARRFDFRLPEILVLLSAQRNSWGASRFRHMVYTGQILMRTCLFAVFWKASTGNFRKNLKPEAVELLERAIALTFFTRRLQR